MCHFPHLSPGLYGSSASSLLLHRTQPNTVHSQVLSNTARAPTQSPACQPHPAISGAKLCSSQASLSFYSRTGLHSLYITYKHHSSFLSSLFSFLTQYTIPWTLCLKCQRTKPQNQGLEVLAVLGIGHKPIKTYLLLICRFFWRQIQNLSSLPHLS